MVGMCFKPFYYLWFLERRKSQFEFGFLKASELLPLLRVVAKLPKIQVRTQIFKILSYFWGQEQFGHDYFELEVQLMSQIRLEFKLFICLFAPTKLFSMSKVAQPWAFWT